MTIIHQTCADCPHRPKSDLSAEPFDRDVAMRSLEYAAVRLGMHWDFERTMLDSAVRHVRPKITEEPIPPKKVRCFTCGGDGFWPNYQKGTTVCTRCGGTGLMPLTEENKRYFGVDDDGNPVKTPIIDADIVQRQQFSLRSEK